MRLLCLHGISKDAWNRYSDRGNWQYDVVQSGFKYNLSDIQSAIGIHQLRKQERFRRDPSGVTPVCTVEALAGVRGAGAARQTTSRRGMPGTSTVCG